MAPSEDGRWPSLAIANPVRDTPRINESNEPIAATAPPIPTAVTSAAPPLARATSVSGAADDASRSGPRPASAVRSATPSDSTSNTRAGVPCFGCTAPNFPAEGDLFRTEKIADVPIKMPLGVARGQYMAYKNLAKAAAPVRVRGRKMEP